MTALDKKMDRVVVPGLTGARKVYVLKHLGDERKFVAGSDYQQVTTSDELASAQHFASRLAARGFTLNADKDKLFGFVAAEWDVVQIELVPEEPKIEVIDGLMVEDPVECARKLCDLHFKYADRVAAWVRKATNYVGDYSPPKIVVTARPQMNWTGLYSPTDHTCHYVLPMAMLNLGRPMQDYEETVAHEVVHAYQRLFVGQDIRSGHGGDFYAMMRHAALWPTKTHTHAPLPGEFQKCILLFKKLQKPIERLAEGGLLASLPCQIVTEKLKRRGIQ